VSYGHSDGIFLEKSTENICTLTCIFYIVFADFSTTISGSFSKEVPPGGLTGRVAPICGIMVATVLQHHIEIVATLPFRGKNHENKNR